METNNNNNVSIGPTTIVGWLTAVLALLPTIIKSVEEGQVAFNGPEKYLAILGIATGLVTQIARYFQAHKKIPATKIAQYLPSTGDLFGKGEESPHSIVDDLPIAASPTAGEVPKDNSVLAPPVSAE